jgi:hypothetical protein
MCRELNIALPGSFSQIDPSAFGTFTWRNLTFEGPSPFVINDDFVRSADSKVIVRGLSSSAAIPADVEVIGCRAFAFCREITSVAFENGSKLREIADSAFSACHYLESFKVPSSVETLGPSCFGGCSRLTAVTFEEHSKLKRIEKLAFSRSKLNLMTIPAGTEEIEGSAFANCPIIEIRVAAGNRHFRVEGKMLLTLSGTEIVRYFGMEREVFVSKAVEVLRVSSFESCHHVQRIVFEKGSKLRIIGFSALAGCQSLIGIAIPASVATIEGEAFRGCHGLESCVIDENAILVEIGNECFVECHCLESFCIPRGVETIGRNCFKQCASLHRLKFQSEETLKRIIGNATLDEFLERLGFAYISSLFRVEIETRIIDSDCADWVSVFDESSHSKPRLDTE